MRVVRAKKLRNVSTENSKIKKFWGKNYKKCQYWAMTFYSYRKEMRVHQVLDSCGFHWCGFHSCAVSKRTQNIQLDHEDYFFTHALYIQMMLIPSHMPYKFRWCWFYHLSPNFWLFSDLAVTFFGINFLILNSCDFGSSIFSLDPKNAPSKDLVYQNWSFEASMELRIKVQNLAFENSKSILSKKYLMIVWGKMASVQCHTTLLWCFYGNVDEGSLLTVYTSIVYWLCMLKSLLEKSRRKYRKWRTLENHIQHNKSKDSSPKIQNFFTITTFWKTQKLTTVLEIHKH